MKYTLTFTSDPNAYDWGDTDTILFEYPADKLPDYPELEQVVEQILAKTCDYLDKDQRENVAKNHAWWFVRNCNDTDVVIDKKVGE